MKIKGMEIAVTASGPFYRVGRPQQAEIFVSVQRPTYGVRGDWDRHDGETVGTITKGAAFVTVNFPGGIPVEDPEIVAEANRIARDVYPEEFQDRAPEFRAINR